MPDEPLIGPVAAPELQVMTFNIRRRMPRAGRRSPDRWENRAPALRQLLQAERPTVLGVQEALPDQTEFVAESLGSRYSWIGRGRDADGTGEACPVFFDTTKVRLLEWTQLALSDTPRVAGSRSWGNHVPRVVVWAVFEPANGGSQFRFLNTHFDHQSRRARVRSAELILRLVDSSQGPALVTGDFNTSVGTSPHQQLTIDGSLRDAWDTANTRLTKAWGTYPNYHPPKLDRKRIDWILANRWVDVRAVGINTARFDTGLSTDVAASDHLPVQAVVQLQD